MSYCQQCADLLKENTRLREAVRESINAVAAKDYEEAYNRLYWAYYGPKGNAAAEQGEGRATRPSLG